MPQAGSKSEAPGLTHQPGIATEPSHDTVKVTAGIRSLPVTAIP